LKFHQVYNFGAVGDTDDYIYILRSKGQRSR